MPPHGVQHRGGAPGVQPGGIGIHGLGQADAPQRRRAPFAAVGRAIGHAVGQALAHVVHQHVGVGPDQLEAVLRLLGIAARHILGHVAGHAIGFVEKLLARQHARIVRVASRRHRKIGGIDRDEVHQLGRDFLRAEARLCTMRHVQALLLRRRPCRWRTRQRFAARPWAARPSG
ncbi:hypothetical protein G6F50_015965 [Rhizopus delemar]|uniref:Uncharacterized protein n=1 Tax=Rhizopus delemar TaxID=936053 RepID=A0A9P6XW22_9FUNG|nr:hypothetical protein G6F50_015965 [Rhizopus delemar]